MSSMQGDPPGGNNYNPNGLAPGLDPYRFQPGPSRGAFVATGGAIFAMFLLLKGGPLLLQTAFAGIYGAANGVESLNHDPQYQVLDKLLTLVATFLGFIYAHEVVKFEWNNAVIDGRQVSYRGSLGGFLSALAGPAILTACTLGIYTPWFMCAYYRYIYENSDAQGERLEFSGTGGDFFPVMLVNGLLTIITLGIYSPWAMNNVWEWYWQHTGINGRALAFRRDGGDFFGTWLLNIVLSACTCGLYWPWALANFRKWELEHVS